MNYLSRRIRSILLLLVLSVPLLVAVPAHAATDSSSQSGAATTDKSSDRLSVIKTAGDKEIERRLKTLGTLAVQIAATTKITPADRASLLLEVNTEITGLKALRTKLAGETTIAGAVADVQSMITEYRVYALVVPKVQLIKTADAQQLVQAQLTTLAAKLQTRITQAHDKGKNVTDLQTKLDGMEAKMIAAESISGDVEQKLLTLEPTTYNNDHDILRGYQTQLKTAHQNNVGALADATAILVELKAL